MKPQKYSSGHIIAMNSPRFLLQWLLLSFLILLSTVSALKLKIPRLNPLGSMLSESSNEMATISDLEDFKTFYYNQTLDHFNFIPESYTTFQQKYVINFKYWGGANASAPIFAYLGAEDALDDAYLTFIGFLTENAPHFKALLVYIEHRYYGNSIPFDSKEAFRNASTLGYFSSAQAIADYAEILMYIKKYYHAENSPVIVLGGSYGGMLASWFRLKYPHVALGALASSAPILYFDDITPHNGYYSVVTNDFREVSETCYQTIKDSWDEIDKVASMPNGLSILSKKFNTCNPLNNSFELKNYLDGLYCSSAQYNREPRPQVKTICYGIDRASFGNDTLSRIYYGLHALGGNYSSCYVNPIINETETDAGWDWQTCSDMVMPIDHGNGTMFPTDYFDINSYTTDCMEEYGVPPRSHWVATYYGGNDIKLIFKRFGSNIIFSNGLKDPYSIGGVLEDLSDSIVAVTTTNGSHCLDILLSSETDPEWLVQQRKIEIKIIESWLADYYANLYAHKV